MPRLREKICACDMNIGIEMLPLESDGTNEETFVKRFESKKIHFMVNMGLVYMCSNQSIVIALKYLPAFTFFFVYTTHIEKREKTL